jgi:2-polyprenyl-3-methyl-5-hydroxy-6-metoxy-1,4-benzoquinol methylase
MKNKEIFEKAYEKSGAVWTSIEPPIEIVKLIENGKIKPCKCLDIGCGEGFYSIYLASKGFEVTGIDLSENAIKYAKQNASKKGVKIKFITMNVSDLSKINEKFDFVFEWALLHHIIPEKRKRYVKDVSNLLNKGGKYFSVCFNEKSDHFASPGKKERIVPQDAKILQGQKLYFSSLEELKNLFEPYFKIIESRLIKMKAGKRDHFANYFFMEKK